MHCKLNISISSLCNALYKVCVCVWGGGGGGGGGAFLHYAMPYIKCVCVGGASETDWTMSSPLVPICPWKMSTESMDFLQTAQKYFCIGRTSEIWLN